MDNTVILFSAASIALIHTLLGPDHYLPFVLIAKGRKWSVKYMLLVTFVCGLGHLAGSVVLGLAGIGFGFSLGLIETVESVRSDIAAWLLLALGIAYTAWGIRKMVRDKKHSHTHDHGGIEHTHFHDHHKGHAHVHGDSSRVTPWALFIIFVLGPCEPLVPLLIYPAAKSGLEGVLGVILVFGLVTVVTMLVTVYMTYKSASFLDTAAINRYMNPIAGVTVAVSGLLILTLNM